MRHSLLAVLCLITSAAVAQKTNLRGQVLDSAKMALPSATVMLLSSADSSLVNFGVSNSKGYFEVKGISRGRYWLKITFVGYRPLFQTVEAVGEPELDLGVLLMQPLTQELAELIVQGEKNPVTVKKDTIEFNAGSFQVKTNATVEDLLKKLPGVEVETDGSIKAQGEQVQRVMVDGREFFGRDPKLATRNLPADAVDKVQVYDKKSDQAVFTGIEDGQREKTINLELKEEKRKGAFGTLMAGAGTEDRFQARASINKFSKGQQLSFLGMGNNVNEQGFSVDDYMNFSGGSQQLMGGGGGGGRFTVNLGGDNSGVPLNFGGRQNGIVTNYAGGINFNKDVNTKTQVSTSYFYNHVDQSLNTDLTRVNYFPAGNYTFNQQTRQLNLNDNHRANLVLDHKLDSSNSLKLTANLSYNESEQTLASDSESRLPDGSLQNTSQRATFQQTAATTLNTNLLWRHRFEKKGRFLTTNLTFGLGLTDSDGNQQSTNEFFGNQPEQVDILQTNTQENTNYTYAATVAYTEPLGNRKYLEANYTFRSNINDFDRQVFDEQGGSLTFNPQLSNIYTSNFLFNRPGLNFRLNRQKYNLTVGGSYQVTNLTGDLEIQNVTIDRTFENFLPSARFNYDFSSFKHLRLDYETSMQEPTIRQLQPVIDNSDPLNLYIGNPELAPAYQHRLTANFTTFDPGKFVNLFAFFTATYNKNAITNSQNVDPQTLQSLTRPVNTDYAMVLTGNVNFGFPIKKLKSRVNIGPTANRTRSVNLLNGQENIIRQQTAGGTVRYNFTFKEIVTLDLSANLSHQQTMYEFDNQQDQVFFNKTYGAEFNLNFLKNYAFNTNFNYFIYNSQTTDFEETIPLLDISISRFILKNKTGELKLGVVNALDQNQSVTQTATANYYQQQVTNNLGRYFMLSFTYALNKQLNPMGMRRPGGGGMRMMIRN